MSTKNNQLMICGRVVCLWLALSATGVNASAQQGWVALRRGAAGKDLNAVYFADTKRGWIAGDGGLVFHTEDGGSTWAQQPVGITESVNDLYFRDRENGYLLAGGRILSTADAGQTWHETRRFLPADFGGASPELYSVRFATKKKGWIVGSLSKGDLVVDSLLLYTDDGGATWQPRRVPTRVELIHLDFVSDKRGWIVGNRGTILHTENGGETWTPQRSHTNATLYHVDFSNREIGWAVGERGTMLRTIDGGDVWTSVDVPLARSTLLSVSFVNAEVGWIVGRGGVILRSSDGGRTWLQQESGTKQNLFALYLNKKNGWAVGGDGMVLQYER